MSLKHPAEWEYSGYNEIQLPRKRYALIDHKALNALLGFRFQADLAEAHRRWVDESVRKMRSSREAKWTESIAVGNKEFIESTKAKWRKMVGQGGVFELRESSFAYNRNLGPENGVLSPKNAYLWKLIA